VLSLLSDESAYRHNPASAVAQALPAKRAEASPASPLPQEQALKEAHERVAELEKNVADLQKLVELNHRSLAALHQQLAAQQPSAGLAPEVLPSAAPPAAEKPIGLASETTTARQPETHPAEAAQPVREETAAPATATATATAAEDSLFLGLPTDRLWLFLAISGAILLLLAIFGRIKRRRQGAQKDGLPPTVRSALLARSSLAAKSTLLLQGGGSIPNSVFQSTGGQSIDTANGPPPSDFSQTGPGSIDTDEVDPVAEADVYMAYGRDVQAEEILLEARQKDPKRAAIHLRLLSIYAKRNDVKQFETLAADLYAETRGTGTRWEKAAAMGFKLNPNNPLFGGGNRVLEPEAAAQPPPNSLEFAEPMPPSKAEVERQTAPLEAPVALALAAAPSVATPSTESIQAVLPEAVLETEPLEFDFGDSAPLVAAPPTPMPTPTPTPETFGIATNVLHFNLPDAAPAAEVAVVAKPARLPNDADLDFDLVFDVKMTESTVLGQAMQPPSLMTPTRPMSLGLDHFAVDGPSMPEERMGEPALRSDFGPLALEMPEKSGEARKPPDLPPLAQVEPVAEVEMPFNEQVATKLDLANAYQETGNLAGARDLLQEVLQEGDAAQREKAQALLARIDP
jgi:pilus assembly protein FimV